MKKPIIAIILILLFLISGCSNSSSSGAIQKVGLLVPETVNDQVWGTKGYKGLLRIQSAFDAEVFYKEGMDNEDTVSDAIREFSDKDITLIFGHGSEYASWFNKLAPKYPNIHFVCFNGDVIGDNVTSLNFKSDAMGFFGGMVASEMTKTNKVGVIAAFEWQPEVNGFFEGAHYQNPEVEVKINYTEHWDNVDVAMQQLDQMLASGVDVVYPAGDGFNVPMIEKLKEEGLYAIGFISDQSDLGEATVLTSTVQHVDLLYEVVAKDFNEGKLKPGNLYFDFDDKVITMGKFSSEVRPEVQAKINESVETYIKTGNLPNQVD
ncbi:BMP family ABC transporter substrate-binding protein [Bacillus suaedaesalsae]|uniref:BMP family ABC transporter substrate-binding protein n=1 Tax=Bacillus suaedaesalsae TaxID=2810349 RepID=A0ABS2DLE1_9BACI|nr:BMP family ABC transporter substrate-binding protein [Bacillus suaedaesalsae]MBM6618298.1 BMP family ABC transporter substrate-binding protein [Bacillus suaedaesalsae]